MSNIKQLRPISGVLNTAKVADKILSEYMITDMSEGRDRQQYGNEKGVSINHLLVKLVDKILTAVDKNNAQEKNAVILTMLDMSQAFERQSHYHGIKSFIANGVRPSLIPVLISFFENRVLVVKWKGIFSSPREVAGGSPQGLSGGILEFLSQTAHNLAFLPEDEAWKFADDSSFVEVVNLAAVGLASFNAKHQVPSDIATDQFFLPPENIKTQEHLNRITDWADSRGMKLNHLKTKYMIINFCSSYPVQTRLHIKDNPIEQVHSARLLGLELNDEMRWQDNVDSLVQRANKQMVLVRNLLDFSIPGKEIIQIYNICQINSWAVICGLGLIFDQKSVYVLKSILSLFKMEKKWIIIASFDLKMFFDSEDIFDCIDALYQRNIRGKLYRLLFNMH